MGRKLRVYSSQSLTETSRKGMHIFLGISNSKSCEDQSCRGSAFANMWRKPFGEGLCQQRAEQRDGEMDGQGESETYRERVRHERSREFRLLYSSSWIHLYLKITQDTTFSGFVLAILSYISITCNLKKADSSHYSNASQIGSSSTHKHSHPQREPKKKESVNVPTGKNI